MQATTLDGAVVVTTPQGVALADVRRELTFCTKLQIPVLGLVENMSGFVCPCCEEVTNVFAAGGGQQLAQTLSLPLLATLPLDPRLGACAGDAVSCMTKFPDSPTSKGLGEMVEKVCKALSIP